MDKPDISKIEKYKEKLMEFSTAISNLNENFAMELDEFANELDLLCKDYRRLDIAYLDLLVKSNRKDKEMEKNAAYKGILNTLIGEDTQKFIELAAARFLGDQKGDRK